MTGAEMIAAERERQIREEGYTLDHDAGHGSQDLLMAAIAYAIPRDDFMEPAWWPSRFWPWRFSEFKPSADRVRDLVKAGALIAAAIDAAQGWHPAAARCLPDEHLIYESCAICGDVPEEIAGHVREARADHRGVGVTQHMSVQRETIPRASGRYYYTTACGRRVAGDKATSWQQTTCQACRRSLAWWKASEQ